MAQALEGNRVELAMAYAAKRVGLPSLNEKQKEAVRACLDGKDVFVSLLTGFGKLVCFQTMLFVFDYLISSQSSYVEDRHIALVVQRVNRLAILFLIATTAEEHFSIVVVYSLSTHKRQQLLTNG